MKIKKLVGLAAVLMAFVLVLSACGAKEDPEENNEGIANPWTEAKTAEEAAEGAKLDSFDVEGIEISLGKVEPAKYRYMTGLAEAEVPIGAVEMTIRKGDSGQTDFGDSDCSGDYNDYKYNWTEEIDGMEVFCYGNRKGESTKTAWTGEKYSFAVLAHGAGGDDDYGLPPEDVEIMVKSIK